MNFSSFVGPVAVAIFLSITTLISLKKQNKFSTFQLILIFIIELVVLVAAGVGVIYLMNTFIFHK